MDVNSFLFKDTIDFPHALSFNLNGNDDWNSRFITVMRMPESTTEEKLMKYTILNGLNRDFISASTTYAKTIISEYFLDTNLKSVKVEQIGGFAGGKKFMWRGILFKLASGEDCEIYGNNDDYAAKAMGNEIKGANSYFRCGIPDLHIGLQALIDYKGFRMHAQAVLPIDKTTIKMGSFDGAQHVFADDTSLMEKLKFAASELNLREHIVRGKKLYSAVDVEGHVGRGDGRYYIIDLARAFPPESPFVTGSDNISIFWKLIRPEFVKHRGLPLIQSIYQQTTQLERQGSSTGGGGSSSPSPYAYPSSPSATTTTTTTTTMSSSLSQDVFAPSSANASSVWMTPPPAKRATSGAAATALSMMAYKHANGPSSAYSCDERDHDNSTNVLGLPPPTISLSHHNSSSMSSISYDVADDVSDTLSATSSSTDYRVGDYCMSSIDDEDYITRNQGGYINDTNPISHHVYDAMVGSAPEAPSAYQPGNVLGMEDAKPPSLSRQISHLTIDSVSFPVEDDYDFEKDMKLRQKINLLSTIKSLTCPALSPDSYTTFAKDDPECGQRNREIDDATKLMLYCLIPCMAEDLIRNGHPRQREGLTITEYMHKQGVNLRHLGLLRKYILVQINSTKSSPRLKSKDNSSLAISLDEVENEKSLDKDRHMLKMDTCQQICDELLQECIIRTLKTLLRRTQRTWMKEYKTSSEDGMLRLIVKFLNLITITSSKSEYHRFFWQEKLIPEILMKFGKDSLTSSEQDASYLFDTILSGNDIRNLITALCRVTGITLTTECLKQMKQAGNDMKIFEFTVPDIYELKPVIKHMHQVDLGEGIMLSLQAEMKESQYSRCENTTGTVLRLISMAVDKLHSALKAVPDDISTIHALADAYQTKGFAITMSGDNISTKDYEFYRTLIQSDMLTRCSITKKSYREEILGYCVVLDHFDRNSDANKRVHTLGHKLSVQDHNVIRIRDSHIYTKCIGLSYYQDHTMKDLYGLFPTSGRNKVNINNKNRGGVSGTTATADDANNLKNREEDLGETVTTNVPEKVDESSYAVRFLPLVVDEEHFLRCEEILRREIVLMDQMNNKEYMDHKKKRSKKESHSEISTVEVTRMKDVEEAIPKLNSRIGLRVMSAVLTSMVVEFVNTCDDNSSPSESSLIVFTRMHHMLLYLSREDHTWREEADRVVQRFLSPNTERKDEFPDIGRLLIYVLMSHREWDEEVANTFVLETMKRQVKWFATSCSDLCVLEDDAVSTYRLLKTFEATRQSLRIVMFQIYFIKSVAVKAKSSSNISAKVPDDNNVLNLYNASLGRPTAAMMNDHRTHFSNIWKVSNYELFLQRIGCSYSPTQFCAMLRNAIRLCQSEKYVSKKFNLNIYGSQMLEPFPPSGGATWKEALHPLSVEESQKQMRYRKDKIRELAINRREKKVAASGTAVIVNNGRKDSQTDEAQVDIKESKSDINVWRRGNVVQTVIKASAVTASVRSNTATSSISSTSNSVTSTSRLSSKNSVDSFGQNPPNDGRVRRSSGSYDRQNDRQHKGAVANLHTATSSSSTRKNSKVYEHTTNSSKSSK